MDTPITALKWLLASDEKSDEYLREIEELNRERQVIVKSIAEKALMEANPDDGILFFVDSALEHGLIGLVAGKLTEAYHQPSIVLCEHVQDEGDLLYVASCRSPEWCNLLSSWMHIKNSLCGMGDTDKRLVSAYYKTN
jgi:single-stranded DNA-specific DHH superfamily exonuclease